MDREFTLMVDGKRYQIEMQGNSLLVDGQPFVIGYDENVLTVDGIAYQVDLEERSAVVDGQRFDVEAAGMSVRAATPKTATPAQQKAAAGANSVTAIMPGAILKVLVAEGDQVEAGDVVIILEAMKMENEIQAHRAGRVTRVHVSPGDNVENHQALVEIE